ncbi:uracil phosphoribosyltransferase [Cyanobium sp. NIES-981]|uniref:uracil phosphoribosyltransferase n=1 Tax=Cyanobium sp. NIES-981 TaxID=1851505 RepID=UPI0007DD5EB7|nr:uracil phosphoribosyltransferase [Cyanobium sp. NIES-981]SBO42314.1 Uracil phosphoribosyltransferase [Cyanobium sp. NIES-981]
MGMTLRVVVPPHPLIGHWLSVLRNRHTPPAVYATATAELGRWLTYEALRDWLPQRSTPIEGCLGATEGRVVDPGVPLLALPVLTAGLGLWDGARQVLPAARVQHVDRCGSTLPASIESRCGVLVFAPEVATGHSLVALLEQLERRGVSGDRLRVVATLASGPGLSLLGERFPWLTLYTSCVDPGLTERQEIEPGIGRVAERLFALPATPAADAAVAGTTA